MKLDNLFERMEPPPHGLIKLRNKLSTIDHREARPSILSWVLLKNRFVQAGALCVVALVTVLLFHRTAQHPNLFATLARADGAEIFAQAGYVTEPTEPVVQVNGRSSFFVAQQTPSQNNVRFYWVQ